MKLYYSPTSPYVRKCLVAAYELGLSGQIGIVPVTTLPTAHSPELMRHNPLCKLPTLVTEDGAVLYDSRVICDYLNDLAGGSLIPAGTGKWPVAVGQALADGVLDAALLMRYEAVLRPAEHRWTAWSETQEDKVRGALARFEETAAQWSGRIDMRTIALACALSYLDLRFPDLGWRVECPRLADWFTVFAARPSMRATELKG